MKKTGIIMAFFFILLLMNACTSKVIFDEHFKFENYTWNHFKPVIFNPEIEDIESCYDITLSLRHTSQIPYDKLPVLITLTAPSGAIRTFPHTFDIKNKEGSFLGNGMGDIWDVEDKVKEYFFFNEQGKYEVKVNVYTQYLETVYVMDLGLKIKKSKLDYNIE